MKQATTLILVLAFTLSHNGCNSQPTSKGFQQFMESYCKDETENPGDLPPGDYKMELLSYNVEKTDSLTYPYKGTATVYTSQTIINDEEAAKLYGEKETVVEGEHSLSFGWVDGQWQKLEG